MDRGSERRLSRGLREQPVDLIRKDFLWWLRREATSVHLLDQPRRLINPQRYSSHMTHVSANVSAKARDFASASVDAQTQKAPQSRAFQDGRGGFRTCDLSRVKRALSH
jgi:hypothetical protein